MIAQVVLELKDEWSAVAGVRVCCWKSFSRPPQSGCRGWEVLSLTDVSLTNILHSLTHLIYGIQRTVHFRAGCPNQFVHSQCHKMFRVMSSEPQKTSVSSADGGDFCPSCTGHLCHQSSLNVCKCAYNNTWTLWISNLFDYSPCSVYAHGRLHISTSHLCKLILMAELDVTY